MTLKSLSSQLRRRRGATPPSPSENTSRRHRPHHRWRTALIVIVTLLLLVRFVGSPIAKSMVNEKLAQIPGFAGRAEDVTLALWRGAVDVNNFVVYERGHEDDPPLVHIRKASIRLAPGALFGGKIGAAATVDGAELNIVKREKAPEKDEEETSAELQEKKREVQRWQTVFREAVPMELTRLEVKNTRVRFIDITTDPRVDVGVEDLHIVATDLQNRPEANGDPLPAKIQIDALTTGNGKLHVELQVNPIAKQPRFTANFELREMELPPANSFLLAYANADVSRGSFEVFMEIEAKDGAYDGYVKPLFHDLEFETASDKDKNAAELLAKKVVTTVASVLENDEKEQVATKAPFAGNFAENELDIWSTIGNLFRNAFVQALRGGFEGQTPRQ